MTLNVHGFLRPFGGLIALVWLLLFLGCHSKQVQPKPIVKRDNRAKWKFLAPYIKKHFKTDMTVKEIAAELAYQEYLQNKE